MDERRPPPYAPNAYSNIEVPQPMERLAPAPSPPSFHPPSAPKVLPTAREPNPPRSSSNVSMPPPYPAKYVPSVPFPFMSGYLEKSTGDHTAPLKSQSWSKKYVEVSDGTLRFFTLREEREDTGVVVPLSESFVSVQAKRIIRLESKTGIRIFRAQSESRAYHWVLTISRYCLVAPTAEGFCKKLSGGKNVMEDRYLRLHADGILSWFKSEKEDADCRGSIQVRGERISIDPSKSHVLLVQTKERRYMFELIDAFECNQWYAVTSWHSHRRPLENTAIAVRNKGSVSRN
uniref:Uncharacterized LOC100179420 n=1 Tax=Ciona intestinalis TaxID=7719 RepID=H2XUR4_CIOIN|nr:uncharacterized protein LOC100179420 [Ciona intestinalis]|eukprot:XP_002131352.1 uncharacterized protein LOC100179420 [Ciona intestinalis]